MRRKAFTLIELLVVIAIIAILASILFPVFAQAKNAAKKTASLSQVKQVSLATTMYVDQNDDRTMALYWLDGNPNGAQRLRYPSSDGQMYWSLALFPFVKSEDLFRCPADKVEDVALADPKGRGRLDKSSSYYYYVFGATPSYGYNYRYLNLRFESPDPNGSNPLPFYYTGVGMGAIDQAASTVLFAESTMKDRSIPPSSGIRGGTVANPIGYARIESPAADPATRKKAWSEFPSTDAGSRGQLYPRFSKDQVITAWLDGHVTYRAVTSLVGSGSTRTEIDRFWNGQGN